MAISFVQSTDGATNSSTPATTSSITTTSGNLVVVTVVSSQTGTWTMSDNKSNTWTQVGSTLAGGGGFLSTAMYYAKNLTGGSGHTFSIANTGSFPSLIIIVQEFSGIDTTAPLDKTTGTTGSGTSADSGATATTTQADELVVAGGSTQSATVPTAGSGYSNLRTKINGGNNESAGQESKIVAATATYNGTFTMPSASWAAIVATFKATAGAAFIAQPNKLPNQAVRNAGSW